MPVTVIGQTSLAQPQYFATPIIEIKKRWSDAWQFAPELEALFCGVYASSSAVSQLQVRRKFGNRKMPYERAFGTAPGWNLDGWWVRLRLMSTQGPITQFVGQFRGTAKAMQGTPTLPAGEQIFNALGGLHLLQNVEVGAAYFSDGAGANIRKVDWLPSMNARDRRGLVVGNADLSVTTPSRIPVYGGKDRWSHFGYLNYLIERFVQQTGGPTWTIGGQTSILKGMLTTIDFPEVARVSDMLRELIPVKHGIDYCVVPTDAGFQINIFALIDQSVSIGGVTLPKNPNTVRVIKSNQLDLVDCRIVQSNERRVDRIVVQGQRITVCGSLRGSRGPVAGGTVGASGASSLVARWDATLESQYISGDGLLAILPGAVAEDFDAARLRDKFRMVYAAMGAPTTWDLEGGRWALACKDDGKIITSTFQTAQRETLSRIPLKEGFDYSTNPPTDQTGGTIEAETKPPLAWVYDETPRLRQTPGYIQANLAGIRVHQPYQDWGLWLCAEPNERLALNHWTPSQQATSGGDAFWFDYNTAIATIAIHSDHRLQVAYTVPANLAAGDGSTMIVTDDGAELWVLLPGTVVDVDQLGNLKTSGSARQVLRNDVDRISLLAAGLAARYISSRYHAQLDWKGAMPWGSMIGSILDTITQGTNSEKLSAPITSVEWTFTPSPTTVLKAGYA